MSTIDKNETGWKEAAEEARKQIVKLEEKANRLKISVRVFEENERNAVPFTYRPQVLATQTQQNKK